MSRLFPPPPAAPDQTRGNKGRRSIQYVTVNGPVEVTRSVYWNRQQGSLTPADQWLDNIGESVRAGKSLAQAMFAWPKIFPRTCASMVNVGEEAGLLAEMLRRLAKSLDEEQQLRGKLRAAMVYPLFLVCVGLGTVLVLMMWVIPKFRSFFLSLQQQSPLPPPKSD